MAIDRPPPTRLRRALAGTPLSSQDEAAYEQERLEHNRRIVRALIWLVIPIHGLTLLAFWGSIGPRGAGDPFRETVMRLHLLALPCSIALTVLVLRVEPRWHPWRWQSWASDLYCAFYLLLAAALSTNAQRLNGNVNVFVLVTLTTSILFRLRGRALAIIGSIGSCALTAGIVVLVDDTAARIAVISPVFAVWAIAIAAALVQVATARSELAARREAERGREELAAQQQILRNLNDGLEQRVTEQVAKIVAHAEEIEVLNRHLRVQIADRSRQLAQALASLDRVCPPLTAGDVLDGRVEILERIGLGGMGEVYRGHDRVLGRDVAVKVPQADSTVNREVWLRFANEARAAATVTHPAVVRTLHVGISEEGRLYQLQDLIDGTSLAAVLEQATRWPATHVARIGAVIADALAAAHAAGVVHRDVKPSNVMLSRHPPGVLLLDFGVSKLRDEIGRATVAGTIVGTPRYMAPEQIATPDSAGPAVDVYALGVLLHELISGAPPFRGHVASMLDGHLSEPPPRLGSSEAPDALADLVLACLAKQPTERPCATSLARSLRALADEANVPAAELLPLPQPSPQAIPDRADTVPLMIGRG